MLLPSLFWPIYKAFGLIALLFGGYLALGAEKHRRGRPVDFPDGTTVLDISKPVKAETDVDLIRNNDGRSLRMDCDLIAKWFMSKLNEGSACSGMMVVDFSGEKEAHLYALNTVQEAIDKAHADLRSKYSNATQYVIAYDAGWMDKSGNEYRAIYVEAEERTTGTPKLLAYRITPLTGAPFSFTGEVFERKAVWSLYNR
jgi:hypothetical protein